MGSPQLVCFQLTLFPWRPIADSRLMPTTARAKRTPQQFLKSAAAYCLWRAGVCWRFSSDRWHPDRIAYLQAESILSDAVHRDPARMRLELPPLAVGSPLTPLEQELASRPRAWLVAELLDADPRFTDRKLLSNLPPKKLARMLAAAPCRTERKQA